MGTVKYSTKLNARGCFSSHDFGRIIFFKWNLNAELMCDIYKRGTVPKQFGFDSTSWELQEDNDAKRTWKVELNWKTRHGIGR